MDQRPGHACGVFGVYAPGQPVAHLAYLGLFALQHRGQESAGIAVSDGETITVVKDMGLVTQVFDERRLAPLDGHLAIGHNRYSTTGSSSWRNAQPVYRSVGDAGFALGHNGNLTNTVQLAGRLGMLPGMTAPELELDSTTDSALVAELVAQEYSPSPRSDGRDLEVAL
jgi:amidophosphoribosyltransferase